MWVLHIQDVQYRGTETKPSVMKKRNDDAMKLVDVSCAMRHLFLSLWVSLTTCDIPDGEVEPARRA